MVQGPADYHGERSAPQPAFHQHHGQRFNSIQLSEERPFQGSRPPAPIQPPQVPQVPQISRPRGPRPKTTNANKRKFAEDVGVENFAPQAPRQYIATPAQQPIVQRRSRLAPPPMDSHPTHPAHYLRSAPALPSILPNPYLHVIAAPRPLHSTVRRPNQPGPSTYHHARPTPAPLTQTPDSAAFGSRSTPNGIWPAFPPMKRSRGHSQSPVVPFAHREVPESLRRASPIHRASGIKTIGGPASRSLSKDASLDLIPGTYHGETALAKEEHSFPLRAQPPTDDGTKFLQGIDGLVSLKPMPTDPEFWTQLLDGQSLKESGGSLDTSQHASEQSGGGPVPVVNGFSPSPTAVQLTPHPDDEVFASFTPSEIETVLEYAESENARARDAWHTPISSKPTPIDPSFASLLLGAEAVEGEGYSVSLDSDISRRPSEQSYGGSTPGVEDFALGPAALQPISLADLDFWANITVSGLYEAVAQIASVGTANVGHDHSATPSGVADVSSTTFDLDPAGELDNAGELAAWHIDFSGTEPSFDQTEPPFDLRPDSIPTTTPAEKQPDAAHASPLPTATEDRINSRTVQTTPELRGTNVASPVVANLVPGLVNAPPHVTNQPGPSSCTPFVLQSIPLLMDTNELPRYGPYGRIPAHLVFPPMESIINASDRLAALTGTPVDVVAPQSTSSAQHDATPVPSTSAAQVPTSVPAAQPVVGPPLQDPEPIDADLTRPNTGEIWVLCPWGRLKDRCAKVLPADARSIQTHIEADHGAGLVSTQANGNVRCPGINRCRQPPLEMGRHLLEMHLSPNSEKKICQKCWKSSPAENGKTWCVDCVRDAVTREEKAEKEALRKEKKRLERAAKS